MTGTLLLSVLALLAVGGKTALAASTVAPGSATASTVATDVSTASTAAAVATTTVAPADVSGTPTAATSSDPMAIVALLQQQIQQLTAQLTAQRQIAEQQAAAIARFQAAQNQRPQQPSTPVQTTTVGSQNIAPQPQQPQQQPNPMNAILAQYQNMLQQQQQQQQSQPQTGFPQSNNQVRPMNGFPQPFKSQQQVSFPWQQQQQQQQQNLGSFAFRPPTFQPPTPATRFNNPMRSSGFPFGNNFWHMAMMTDFI